MAFQEGSARAPQSDPGSDPYFGTYVLVCLIPFALKPENPENTGGNLETLETTTMPKMLAIAYPTWALNTRGFLCPPPPPPLKEPTV